MSFLLSLLDKLEVAVVFLIMISVLVAAHEYGHFLFARIFKMGVEEFAIGFGKKPLWVWKRKIQQIQLSQEESAARNLPSGSIIEEETLYTVRPWPVGGFVRINGMMPQEDGSEVHVPGGFYSKPAWQRFIVLLAGPVFSVMSGVILIFAMTMISGVPSRDSVVAKVAPDSPAFVGGIREGDKIVALNDKPISSSEEVAKFDRKPGVPIKVSFERAGVRQEVSLVPEHIKTDAQDPRLDPKDVRLGLAFGRLVPASVGPAFVNAITTPYLMVTTLATQLSSKKVSVADTVGGPASMVSVTNDAVHSGVEAVIGTAALLSISVGIFNLFPIGMLDGGQMLLAFIEIFRRRRLSIQTQAVFMNVGMAIVVTMFVCVMFIDAKRFLPFGKEKPHVTQSPRPAK